MKIRNRLILALLLLIVLGFGSLVSWITRDLRPRYLATMEDTMADTVTILAAFLEKDLDGETIRVERLRDFYTHARRQSLAARIYEVHKDRLAMRVYVTDRQGIVLFDSDGGKDEGKSYLKWVDVGLTLQGKYGARATPAVRGDPATAILYIAAPIKAAGKIVGVVTVCKPAENATRFLDWARRRIAVMGSLAALAVILLGAVIYTWITIPIQKLTAYANAVRDGRRVALPALGRNEIARLGSAFEEMRDALEGKEYISQYVQTLTHEMKSPLSAIRGAAELLEESMPPEQRARFIGNIRAESGRLQDLIDRLLQLSALEKRKGLRDVEPIELGELLEDVVESLRPVLAACQVEIQIKEGPLRVIPGERFLVRQALVNILQNAIEFSPEGGMIRVSFKEDADMVEIVVADEGPGIPDYALGKVFDRFYSLTRPGTGKKSSGLGLTIVREVASLHRGAVRLENAQKGGARATLRLPIHPA